MKAYLIRMLVDYNYMEFEISTNGDIIEAIRAAKKEAKSKGGKQIIVELAKMTSA